MANTKSSITVQKVVSYIKDKWQTFGVSALLILVLQLLSSKDNKNVCSLCGGSGYKGRAGIYEVMRINDSLRELIMNNATADVIRENAFKKSGRSLLSYGMELVKRQLTTIEEVERVCLLEETS